jgi:hypothetical protein
MEKTEFKFKVPYTVVSTIGDVNHENGNIKWAPGHYKQISLCVSKGLSTFEHGGGLEQSFKVCGKDNEWLRMTIRCFHGGFLCVSYHRPSYKPGRSLEFSAYWNIKNPCPKCEYNND